MKSFSSIFAALLLASCAGQPAEDPFDPATASSTDDPWTTEQEVQALREQLGFLKAALESTAPLEEKAIQLFQQGVPRLFAARGSIRRFETHVEQAVLQEDRLKIEVLVSHEALFGEAQNQATEGLTHLVFERSTTEQSWGLTDWRVREEVVYQRDQTLFREALASVVDGPLLSSLRRSLHEEKVLDVLKDRDRDWNHPLEFEAFDRHPGIAIADVDNNGWEDVYLLARWGKNQLLLNDGGRFVEAAEKWGIDQEHHATSAIFADFDNDGDPDLVVGRSLVPSELYENTGKGFVRLEQVGLPSLVSAVAVADVNGDGLLDVYFATYAASMIERIRDLGVGVQARAQQTLSGFLPAEEAFELARRIAKERFEFYLERPGPLNRLLINQGGLSFTAQTGGAAAASMKNTYQAAFSDVDGDGDSDLYLSNDFSPNALYLNDGRGHFADATTQSRTEDFGFGMGVSWGDYDADGRFDLYVSNMYSRTGRRMMSSTQNSDPRLLKAARGNTLFRNDGVQFERSSGLSEGLLVEKAGWSWGGQFLDINNNGLLDLYVPNGYYSAPKEAALDRDT